MNKTEYLDKLDTLLNQFTFHQEEIKDIISDYDDLWSTYADQGYDEEAIVNKLGTPDEIIDELTVDVERKQVAKARKQEVTFEKYIALSPFIALIIFFISGLVFDGWAYAWTAFLIIPVIAILAQFKTMKPIELLTALSPFIALFAYFLIFGALGLWHPGWLIFLIIPAIAILNEDNTTFKVISELLLLLGVLGYLYLDTIPAYQSYAWAAFIPVVLYFLASDQVTIVFNISKPNLVLLLISGAIYVVGSELFDLWGYLWIVFFIIPVYNIYVETKGPERLIAIMPFISVSIFMTLGVFFNGWAYAWLAFLLIPMVAITKTVK